MHLLDCVNKELSSAKAAILVKKNPAKLGKLYSLYTQDKDLCQTVWTSLPNSTIYRQFSIGKYTATDLLVGRACKPKADKSAVWPVEAPLVRPVGACVVMVPPVFPLPFERV